MTRTLLATLALTSALSGCSIVGTTVSVVRARDANYRRELAIARGDKVIPPKADVGQSGMAGFFVGAAQVTSRAARPAPRRRSRGRPRGTASA